MPEIKKVFLWEDLNGSAQLAFDHYADWWNHFGPDATKEAQDYYATCLAPNWMEREKALQRAWDYAQGATRFMQRP